MTTPLDAGAARRDAEPRLAESGDAAPTVDVRQQAPARVPVLPDFAALYRQVRPTVVSLYATLRPQRSGRRGRRRRAARESLGSGILLTTDGEILTNEHVVHDSVRIRVRLADGRIYEATVVGSDVPTDLALLRLVGLKDAVEPAELGDSSRVRVGDWVAAVGNPLGLENTMTRGIISAKGRRQLGNDPLSFVEFLQTDAAINPGSSGGPLFGLDGRVVGINAALNRQGTGIAFAIPANLAREIVMRLRESGSVARAWLGVLLGPSAPDEEGVRVISALHGTAAQRAGLREGDVIRTIDGTPVETPFDLRWRVAMAGVGRRVTLEIRREGETRLVTVRLDPLGRRYQRKRREQ